ncbi:MAG: ArnT family glycosyltransferase [Betaproteobacteria bacterium]
MDAARGMVESGDWLVPRYEGRAFFDKPVLTYWLMAGSMSALGPSYAAARLVPVLAALALALATAWLGVLLFDRRSALAGALVLASTPAFLSFARIAMSDMLLALWTTTAVALALRACRPRPPAWVAPALGAALGLGFATKGPIALVVAGVALLLLALGSERARPLPFGLAGLTLAGAAFAVLGLGWFALVYARLGAGPLVHFFLRENLERFAGEAYDVGRPLWFYPPAYLAEGLPWSCFLPLALWRLLRGGPADRAGARLLAGWAALVVGLLSLSRGKIDYYLLPVYPPLSLVVGRYLANAPWRALDRGLARAGLGLGAAATALLLARPPRVPAGWLPDPSHGPLLVVVATLAALVLLAAALRPTPARVLAALATATAAGFLLLVTLFLPAFSAGQPNRAIAADVARERLYVPRAQLAFCEDPARVRRDVLFAARHAGVEQCDLWSLAASHEPFLFLVSPAQAASFRVLPRYRHVGSYSYLPARALTLDGLLDGVSAGEVQLVANYATPDPVAERKRRKEYRRRIQEELREEARRAAAP